MPQGPAQSRDVPIPWLDIINITRWPVRRPRFETIAMELSTTLANFRATQEIAKSVFL